MTFRASRRAVLKALAGLAAAAPARAQAPDRGIGGTGVAPEPPADRGIGGTGVVGTIRAFGSIVVNGRRIAYGPDVPVTVDGVAADAGMLRLGQVVEVLATEGPEGMAAARIAVVHEVVGRVTRVTRTGLGVLGQTVLWPEGEARRWRRGDRVAVSGLRRPDGVVVASLIEPSRAAGDRLAGIVAAGPGGAPAVGGLRLVPAAGARVGERVVLRGRARGSRFLVRGAERGGAALAALGATVFEIETYVRSSPDGRLDSGLGPLPGLRGFPDEGTMRAVLTARLAPDGGLEVRGLRAAGGPEGGGGPGRGEPPQGVRRGDAPQRPGFEGGGEASPRFGPEGGGGAASGASPARGPAGAPPPGAGGPGGPGRGAGR